MASKVFTIIYDVELGKPVALPNIWVGVPQGATKVQRVKDMVESEWQLVMGCIEVCLSLKRC